MGNSSLRELLSDIAVVVEIFIRLVLVLDIVGATVVLGLSLFLECYRI